MRRRGAARVTAGSEAAARRVTGERRSRGGGAG